MYKSFVSFVAVMCIFVSDVESFSCIQCDSKMDIKCATNPQQFLARSCANNTSNCFTRIDENLRTERGCASDLDPSVTNNCNNEMECLLCNYDRCNAEVFPSHRSQCLQCESAVNGTCATETDARPSICPLYKLGDMCFIRKTETEKKNVFMRGCMSSAGKLCPADKNYCYACDGPGCNYLAAESKEIPLAPDSAAFSTFSRGLLVAVIFAAIIV